MKRERIFFRLFMKHENNHLHKLTLITYLCECLYFKKLQRKVYNNHSLEEKKTVKPMYRF